MSTRKRSIPSRPIGAAVRIAGTASAGGAQAFKLVSDVQATGENARFDELTIDVEKRQLNHEVPEDELARRAAEWKEPEPRYKRGVFAKYANAVGSAAEGAVTR